MGNKWGERERGDREKNRALPLMVRECLDVHEVRVCMLPACAQLLRWWAARHEVRGEVQSPGPEPWTQSW